MTEQKIDLRPIDIPFPRNEEGAVACKLVLLRARKRLEKVLPQVPTEHLCDDCRFVVGDEDEEESLEPCDAFGRDILERTVATPLFSVQIYAQYAWEGNVGKRLNLRLHLSLSAKAPKLRNLEDDDLTAEDIAQLERAFGALGKVWEALRVELSGYALELIAGRVSASRELERAEEEMCRNTSFATCREEDALRNAERVSSLEEAYDRLMKTPYDIPARFAISLSTGDSFVLEGEHTMFQADEERVPEPMVSWKVAFYKPAEGGLASATRRTRKLAPGEWIDAHVNIPGRRILGLEWRIPCYDDKPITFEDIETGRRLWLRDIDEHAWDHLAGTIVSSGTDEGRSHS